MFSRHIQPYASFAKTHRVLLTTGAGEGGVPSVVHDKRHILQFIYFSHIQKNFFKCFIRLIYSNNLSLAIQLLQG